MGLNPQAPVLDSTLAAPAAIASQFRMQFPAVCCPAPSWPSSIGKLSRETAIAFARSYVPGVETASAFAGEKRAFLACFSAAEVMVVSMVAVLG